MTATVRASARARYGAFIAATTLLASIGIGVGPAVADESGSPSASPEAMVTSESASPEAMTASESASPEATTTGSELEANNPDWVPPETIDTYVGQSVQSRRTADGVQNSHLANFRWAVTQVNAESLNNIDTSIPLPMSDAPGLRSLTGGSNMPTEVDGGVLYSFDGVDGVQTKRTLNLWPQDKQLPVEIKAEFTLNGEPVQAQQIVGKGGLVTATYTIINNSVEEQNVDFTNVKGEPDTQPADTSQAFVGISKQFIPQSWAQFDPGHGIFGADGRGNYQTQWITLAFLPFAENGQASFGWSAVIPDGEGFIPKMVMEVSPLFVPAGHAGEEASGDAAAKNGVPKPNLDSATASVHAGVEDLVDGISGLADTIGTATGATKEGLSIAIAQIKAAVADLCAPDLLDCATESDPIDLNQIIGSLQTASDNLGQAIADLEANGGNADDLIAKIDEIKASVADLQDQLVIAQTAVTALIKANCTEALPGYDKDACANANKADGALKLSDKLLVGIQDAFTSIQEDLPGLVGGIQAGLLTSVKATIDGLIVSLTDLQAYLAELKVPLAELQAGIDGIGAALDAGGAILGDVGSSLDQISTGKAQISGGLGAASTEVSAYIADVVAVAKAAAESGKDVAAEVSAHANTIKAQLAGLKGRMAESPLPYGGGMNTVYAPAGDAAGVETQAVSLVSQTGLVEEAGVQPTTELFGAYQFMLDPADNNKPNTPWRILFALIFVVGAGFLAMWAGKRAAAKA